MRLHGKSIHLVCAAGLLMVFAIARLAVVVIARDPQACLEVAAATWDIGRTSIGQAMQHRFMLTNSGNADLLFLETKSGCECVVAQLPHKVLDAGRSMVLDIAFTPKKAGQHQERIVVKTDDPQHPITVLTLNATVYDPATPEARP